MCLGFRYPRTMRTPPTMYPPDSKADLVNQREKGVELSAAVVGPLSRSVKTASLTPVTLGPSSNRQKFMIRIGK